MTAAKTVPPVVITNHCNNLDFEDGNLTTGWVTSRGYNSNSNGPFTVMATPANRSTNQDIYSCNDIQLISAVYGNDPIGFPGLDPNGGNYSARVGGFHINTANDGLGGFACDAFKYWGGPTYYSNGSQLAQTFVVTAANALVSFDFAVVLNDGGHGNGEQPYFHVIVTDLAGVVLNPTCTEYYVQAAAGGPPAGFINSGYVNSGDGSVFYYQNWKSNSINLTTYIGQTVILKFVSAGCIYGGHPAWAYIDATCGPAQVITSNPAPCNGSTAVLTAPPVFGGSYVWTGPGIVGPTNGQTATVNTSGTYSVTVTPSQGPSCAYTLSYTINFATVSAPISASTNVSCNGGNNGSATVNPSGGNPAYTYAWLPSGGNSSAATGLSAGNYTVTVTDAGGCTRTATVTITQPTALSAPASSTPAGCSVSNGTATANPSGGVPGYTYSWSPGGQISQTATGLAGGNYTVVVTDNNGCTRTTTVTVGSTSAPTVSSTSSTAAGCSVNNGTATANPSGGTPSYTYAWSPGGQNSQTATGLAGGTYTCVITDANGCSVTATVNVGSTAAPATTASSTQATCAVANGTGTANPSGGTPGYTYSWSNGQTNQTATGLSPGSYSVVVSDANGCTATATVSITSANGPTLTASTLTNVSCNGGNNGSATATPTGGTPGYTYSWSNGQTNQTATGLTAGTYTVTVTDANNCSFVSTTTVTQPTILAATATPTNVLCNGGNSGSATANPTGGTPGYTYVWSPSGGNAQTANNLSAGTYTVTITDANGCVTTASVSISQPALLTNSVSQTNVLCNSGTNGSATVTPSGGTPGYTYAWSPSGGNAATANNLGAGNYTITITDANGCTSTNTVTITQPAVLAASFTQTNVTCNGGNNGSATVTPSGGTPGYTYSWNTMPVQNTQTAINLGSGIYFCTVTDANGCTTVVPVTITQPTAISIASSQTNILCNGGNNGSATATPSGGTPGYTYVWSPSGGNAQTASGLLAGIYSVTITDANGCTSIATYTITQPPPITLSISGNDTICSGESTVLSAVTSGGTPVYTYVWTPGPSSGSSVTVSPTTSTSYSVVMTDANGCVSVQQTFTVSVQPVPNALFDTSSTGMYSSLYSFNDLSTGGISWLWDFGDNTPGSTSQNPVHTFPGAGTYTVTQIVFNQFGCPDTFKIIIDIGEGILIPNVFTPDGNGQNDVWYVPNSGMKEFHVVIFDRWGAKVWETTADEIRWDGRSSSGQLLTDGTYYFNIDAVLKTGSNGTRLIQYQGYITLLTDSR